MGKISPVSAKYIVHATINIDGIVDRPDVIGAIFGQTEGLLGADLELRELQRSGRIGRIEVRTENRGGKTSGTIVVPSSLDKAETAIVAAALEIIQRIGPCNAKIKTEKIEDVRVSKRSFVVDRAKALLKLLMDDMMPDSQELADEVAYAVRVMEIGEYGKERLPAGPAVEESDDIIIVEGRADVLTLLKHGFKNAVAINGTSVPPTIIELTKRKVVTVFVDGDRGGDLIIKELTEVADIDFVTKAPAGKEVEELTKKELHQALRSKIAAEQAKHDISSKPEEPRQQGNYRQQRERPDRRQDNRYQQREQRQDRRAPPAPRITPKEKEAFAKMLEDLIGTRGACLVDEKLNVLGKVPITELPATIKGLGSGVKAVIFDGTVESDLVDVASKAGVKFLVAMDNKVKGPSRVTILTADNL